MFESVLDARVSISPRSFLLVALSVAGLWLAIRLFPVLLVLLAAAILAGTLSPAVERLERRGLNRGLAIGLVFGGLLTTIALLLAVSVPAFIEQMGTLAENEAEVRHRLVHWLSGSPLTLPLARWLRNVHYAAFLTTSADEAYDLSARAIVCLAYIASAVFLALYFLIDRDRLRGMVFALVPRRHHLRAARVAIELEMIVGGYVRGQLLTSAMMTGFVLALAIVTGIPNPLPIAIIAGASDVLPYVGVVLSIAPVAAAAIPSGIGMVVTIVVAMLVYEELESRFIIPRIYGSALRLPSSVVLVALLAGGTLMGIVGALLALPVAAAVRMLVEELRVQLPGEEPAPEALRRHDEELEAEYLECSRGCPAERAAGLAIQIELRDRAKRLLLAARPRNAIVAAPQPA
jgi:predicted PurR-regulated permease PerM